MEEHFSNLAKNGDGIRQLHNLWELFRANLASRLLVMSDYISGMTDSFAKNLYQELNGIYCKNLTKDNKKLSFTI